MSGPSEQIYPVAEWNVTENEMDLSLVAPGETVFALGNGYMGVRGTFEEEAVAYAPGSFVNGFYETEPIVYGEAAYGFADKHQRMIALADPTVIELGVNGAAFDLTTGSIHAYTRMLRMKTGLLERTVTWEAPDGAVIEVHVKRLVSFRRQHTMTIQWKCRAINNPVELQIASVIRGRPTARVRSDDPRVGSRLTREALMLGRRDVDERVACIRYRTRNTGFDVILSVANVIETEAEYKRTLENSQQEVGHGFELNLDPGQTVQITKFVTTYTGLDHPRKRLTGIARQEVETARRAGFSGLAAEQRNYLSGFWSRSDVVLEGDPSLQQSIRFNIFHLLQAAGRNGTTSVAAKGLTGPGYEGHYFWDTEIYIMPFFTYTNPGIARALLEYRYSVLDRARARARTLGHRGALYPWRTINGDEASAYFPAGTAQYHINADIIYAMRKYVQATGDRWFLLKRGAEMLFETARFWCDLGAYIDGKGFCINEVTGPDEYSALVNNNAFTNLMARDHLEYAAAVFEEMRHHDEAMLTPLVDRLGLDPSEVEGWREAAAAMYLPYDKERGLYAQDDQFFDRAVWDFENTPRDRYPLLLHYHPLNIYRHQVLKQPDLILAMFLQGNYFTLEEKRKNFAYYDPLTTGDSSLAPCIQSLVASEIGETELAYRYFMKTVRMDLDNVNGNVSDGVHTAAMAGTWLSLVYGFAGMRDFNGELTFQPLLPREWDRLQFSILWRGTLVRVTLDPAETTYQLPNGGRVELAHNGEALILSGSDPMRKKNLSDADIRAGAVEHSTGAVAEQQ